MLGWDLGAGRGRVTYCDTPPITHRQPWDRKTASSPLQQKRGSKTHPCPSQGIPRQGFPLGGTEQLPRELPPITRPHGPQT